MFVIVSFLYECKPGDWWYNSDGIPFVRAFSLFSHQIMFKKKKKKKNLIKFFKSDLIWKHMKIEWEGTIVEGQFVFSSNGYDSPYFGIMLQWQFRGGIDEANKLEEWMGIKIPKK